MAVRSAWVEALVDERPETGDGPDFERALGVAAWQRLHPEIRRRFREKPAPGRPITYRGIMHVVECSAMGFLLAQAWRLLGTPFAPWRGRDVPVTIRLLAGQAGGLVWERLYRYPGHRPSRVVSTKGAAADGSLIESLACGFAMRLRLDEAHGGLHFRSTGYVWRWGPIEIPLPELLSPGLAHVLHEDVGEGRFRFAMTIRHRWLGLLFRQDGVFGRE